MRNQPPAHPSKRQDGHYIRLAYVMKIVGLEEHFTVSEVFEAWLSLDPQQPDLAVEVSTEGEPSRGLLEFGTERIATMDEAGVNVQVMSLTTLKNWPPSIARSKITLGKSLASG